MILIDLIDINEDRSFQENSAIEVIDENLISSLSHIPPGDEESISP